MTKTFHAPSYVVSTKIVPERKFKLKKNVFGNFSTESTKQVFNSDQKLFIAQALFWWRKVCPKIKICFKTM